MRARGDKNADGTELTVVEIVSGSFRNISGEISAVDAAQNTITVHDLTTKKNVTVKFNSMQLRKLPTALAQRIAVRLKGGTETAAAGGPGGATADGGGAAGAGGAPAGGRAQAEMHVHGEDLALVEARVGQEEEGRRTSARLLVGNLRSR